MKLSHALFSVFSLFALVHSNYSYALDVRPNAESKESFFIEVTRSGPADAPRIGFQWCERDRPASCVRLGAQESYLVRDLAEQAATEAWQGFGASLFTVAVLAGSVGVGVAGLYTVTVGHAGSELAFAAVGGMTTAFIGSVASSLSAWNQVQQARTLRTDVLSDNLVEVSSVTSFKNQLETVLAKLN